MRKVILLVLVGSLVLFGCGKNKQKQESLESQISTEEIETATQEIQATPVNQEAEEVVQESTQTMPELSEIQQALRNAGFTGVVVDGKKGPKTTHAIKDFQARNNLKVDGKVGPKTWEKLSAYLDKEKE